ncbi:hypothetical protein EJB05_41366, partial [Eragrostis curvula]
MLTDTVATALVETALSVAPCLERARRWCACCRTWTASSGRRRFFGGEAFGFVDVALVPFTPWLPVYERHGGFSVTEVAPRVAAWAKRCGERESVAKSLYPLEKVAEFLAQQKKEYGFE